MNMPLVSIVTVCRNAVNEIAKTIESVLLQKGIDFEYVVIDGKSSDGTLDVIKNYAEKAHSQNIRFSYTSEADKGIYDAMNKGVMLTKGRWICFLNAGDTFYKQDTLYQVFKGKIADDVGVVYGDTIEMYRFGQVFVSADEKKGGDPIMPFCHQSSFTRRGLMTEYKFDVKYKILADHDLFYRLRNDGVKFLHIPVVVSEYDAIYGISANNPLSLQLERHKIYGLDKYPFYFLRYIYTVVRSGAVSCMKGILPTCIIDMIMKYRRR